MADDGEMPPFVRALPAPMRRAIARQCDGDWRRVTLDDDDSVTVHNRPQRGDDDPDPLWVPPPKTQRPPLLPVLPPLPTPLWARGPKEKKPALDTSAFTRVELRPVGRTRRQIAKAKVVQPDAEPIEAPVEEPPLAPPPPMPPVSVQHFPVAPTPAPAPQVEDPPAKKKLARRSGAPRTTREMLGRLLDLGCTYRRIPHEPWANVKFHGLALGQVHTNDDAPRDVIVADYEAMKGAVQALGEIAD